MLTWISTLVLLCAAALLQTVAGHCASLAPCAAGSYLLYPQVCQAEQGWRAVLSLWAPVDVVTNCTTSSYTVVTAYTEQQLRDEVNLTQVKWCGLQQLVSEPAVCRFSLSPLQDTYLAVRVAEDGGLFGKGGPAGLACDVHSSQELSLPHLGLTAVGVMLFFKAASLSMSTTFRLTSGSLMFMSGAVVLLSFMLMRSMPYKRSMVAFFTLSSTSMMAAVRWLYGTWLPDMHSLVLSRPFLLYILIMGLLGLAVTYWMDDTSNVKLNTTIRVTLRLVGLLLVYLGLSDEYAALGVMLLMVASGVLAAVGRRLVRLAWLLVKHTALLLRWLLSTTWRLVWGTSKRAASVAAAAPAALARAAGRASTDSVDAAAGSPVPCNDAKHAAEPLLSDEEEEQRTASKRRQRQRRRGPYPQPAQQQQVYEEAEEQHQRAPLVDKVGSFCDWAATAGTDAKGYQFPSSTPPKSSPWSQERLVMDVGDRQAVSPPPAPQLSPAPSAAGGGQGAISPLVLKGKIVNPLTNKPIAINKQTYNMLISQGYTADLVEGVLLAPGGDAAAAQQAGVGGSSAGRAVTPGSQVRQRASRPRSGAAGTPQYG
ncbi:hypothetical protein COO60DRAFT_4338 [Scenedesmus sp. NREL 46B-D3]|nr:hypothetical protein COO60DRAFT_4338 [Scenedesmus sp. NREL 46B-D3]